VWAAVDITQQVGQAAKTLAVYSEIGGFQGAGGWVVGHLPCVVAVDVDVVVWVARKSCYHSPTTRHRCKIKRQRLTTTC